MPSFEDKNNDFIKILSKSTFNKEIALEFLNKRDIHENTFIHAAIMISCLQKDCCVATLLDLVFNDENLRLKLPVNAVNVTGSSPLHYAAKCNNLALIKNLIKLGSNVNAVNDSGNTPLHYACLKGSKETIKVLLVSGAFKSLEIKNNNDKTPIDLASQEILSFIDTISGEIPENMRNGVTNCRSEASKTHQSKIITASSFKNSAALNDAPPSYLSFEYLNSTVDLIPSNNTKRFKAVLTKHLKSENLFCKYVLIETLVPKLKLQAFNAGQRSPSKSKRQKEPLPRELKLREENLTIFSNEVSKLNESLQNTSYKDYLVVGYQNLGNESSLASIIQNGSFYEKYSYRSKLCFLLELSKALQWLHSNAIYHGNLKSANVFIDQSGMLRISEYGFMTSHFNNFINAPKKIRDPIWVAPEVLISGTVENYASFDVYAFGMIACELMNGELLSSHHKNPMTTGIRVCANSYQPKLKDEIDENVKSLIWNCWKFAKTARPTMNQIVASLGSLLFRNKN